MQRKERPSPTQVKILVHYPFPTKTAGRMHFNQRSFPISMMGFPVKRPFPTCFAHRSPPDGHPSVRGKPQGFFEAKVAQMLLTSGGRPDEHPLGSKEIHSQKLWNSRVYDHFPSLIGHFNFNFGIEHINYTLFGLGHSVQVFSDHWDIWDIWYVPWWTWDVRIWIASQFLWPTWYVRECRITVRFTSANDSARGHGAKITTTIRTDLEKHIQYSKQWVTGSNIS